jgi:hypothetical protein
MNCDTNWTRLQNGELVVQERVNGPQLWAISSIPELAV